MKFGELQRRVHEEIPKLRRALVWFNPDEVTNAAYVIVPMTDGRFTIYHPSGRGEYYQDLAPDGEPRVFANEDDVCDFVWTELHAPKLPERVLRQQTPEEAADQKRRFEESMRNARKSEP
ncbi:hypothetical protein GCM10027413_26220 [Conyzicola nivalis]|uniref:Uncharacterized protein n=1 Tax=Conyzicola nivalis TaxID=1477021 RepID=A0A916S8B4_9MICO|nr:hypothetical protein [Conyzicola nivalis]GGA89590.1 hypothetical protein GCM10010979_00390 [Conyzicola nivalis]